MKRLVLAFTLLLCSCRADRSGDQNAFDYVRADECAGAAQTDLPGIVGGKLVREKSLLGRSTVLVMQAAWDHQGIVQAQSLCTGVLIDSNIVLTAAHCADLLYSTTDLETRVEVSFRARPECDRETSQLEQIKVEKVLLHANWIRNTLQRRAGQSGFSGKYFPDTSKPAIWHGDIALLKLEKSAPDFKVPALLPSEFLSLDAASVFAAGFGTTTRYQEADKSERALRYTTLMPLKKTGLAVNLLQAEDGKVPALEDQILSLVRQGLQNTAKQELLIFDQTKGSGVCSGDSGGPAAMVKDRELVILGVASAVYGVGSRDNCQHLSMYSNTALYKSWIATNYLKLADQNSKKWAAKQSVFMPTSQPSARPSRRAGTK